MRQLTYASNRQESDYLMSAIYINTRQSEEQRIIIAQDGKLTGFEQDIAGWENKKGDIYKGTVTRIEEGLNAAFIDLGFGEDKNGFLPINNIVPNLPGASGGKNKIAEGDSILVQIKKDHANGKGAGLTTKISLAGNYLVLMPNNPKEKTMVSKNTSGKERQQMDALLKQLNIPDGMSAIVRTAGVGRSLEDLSWDLEFYLLKLWNAIENAAQNNQQPILIYRENNLMLRAVRDYYQSGKDQIYCDNKENYEEMKRFISIITPENIDCVHHHDGDDMVPDNIERQADAIYKREIKTESGARLVFDSTEAMVTIDVNSGQIQGHADIEETALKTNIEAAELIAQQLQLRNLSGLIIIDFIDMTIDGNRAKLEEHFFRLLRKDRARVQWTSISKFGLVELSRQRLSRSIEESQSIICKTCHGTGRQRRVEALALRSLRQLRLQINNSQDCALLVHVPTEAAMYLLNEKREELRLYEQKYQCEIFVLPTDNIQPPYFRLQKIPKSKVASVKDISAQAKNNQEASLVNQYKNASPKQAKAVVSTILPDERQQEGAITKLWKGFKRLWKSDDPRPVKKKNNQRYNAKRPRRQSNKPVESAQSEKTAIAKKTPAEGRAVRPPHSRQRAKSDKTANANSNPRNAKKPPRDSQTTTAATPPPANKNAAATSAKKPPTSTGSRYNQRIRRPQDMLRPPTFAALQKRNLLLRYNGVQNGKHSPPPPTKPSFSPPRQVSPPRQEEVMVQIETAALSDKASV